MILLPTEGNLERAAGALRNGELVVIPTETVYGLAALASSEAAIDAVFAAKGRPPTSPLILHVRNWAEAKQLAHSIPEYARLLAEHFWPGPLTLVLPKVASVSDRVTAGLDSVALRAPAHPVARRILELIRAPLAAPSANRFTQLSPTRAEHVSAEIAAAVSMVIDGGPCEIGLESTVVDCTQPEAAILRPGSISADQVRFVAGPLRPSVAAGRSPGEHPRHYAPQNGVELVERADPAVVALTLGSVRSALHLPMPTSPVAYARELYQTLHEADRLATQPIQVERPPESGEWAAVWDRLRRAAG